MTDLLEYINAKRETELFDIKEHYYSTDKKFDLIKDVSSFANNKNNSDKYIAFGIKDKTWRVIGVKESDIPQISDIEQLLNQYIEPNLQISLESCTLKNKTVIAIKIHGDNTNRPYIIKKTSPNNGKSCIRCGEIYLRKGTMNCIANRVDIDEIYALNNNLDVCLKTEDIKIKEVIGLLKSEKYLSLDVQFNNSLKENYNIQKIHLKIKINNEIVVLDECKESIGTISNSDRYFINKNRPLIIQQSSTCFRYLNFRVEQNFVNKIKQESIKSIEILINEGKDEKDYKLI